MKRRLKEWMDSPATDCEIQGLKALLFLVTLVTVIGLVIFCIIVGIFVLAFLAARYSM